jgi:hypothetical protein
MVRASRYDHTEYVFALNHLLILFIRDFGDRIQHYARVVPHAPAGR